MRLRSLPLWSLPVVALGLAACSDENHSTFDFSPEHVEGRRHPALATDDCSDLNAANNVPTNDRDLFVLVAAEDENVAKLKRVWIKLKRTTPRDIELDALRSEPGPDSPAITAEVPEGAPAKQISKASVTVTDIPTKDGETLAARFEIEWADGDVLEASASAPAFSQGLPCKEDVTPGR